MMYTEMYLKSDKFVPFLIHLIPEIKHYLQTNILKLCLQTTLFNMSNMPLPKRKVWNYLTNVWMVLKGLVWKTIHWMG